MEELLQGSPAPHRSHEPDMPILETLETSPNSRKLRESLDSHEDELLEDLATFDEELTKEVDESVVNLANDLIGKIEEQDFDEDEDDARFVYFLSNRKSTVCLLPIKPDVNHLTINFSLIDNFSDNKSNPVTANRNEKPDDDLDLDLHLSEDDDEGLTEAVLNSDLPGKILDEIVNASDPDQSDDDEGKKLLFFSRNNNVGSIILTDFFLFQPDPEVRLRLNKKLNTNAKCVELNLSRLLL